MCQDRGPDLLPVFLSIDVQPRFAARSVLRTAAKLSSLSVSGCLRDKGIGCAPHFSAAALDFPHPECHFIHCFSCHLTMEGPPNVLPDGSQTPVLARRGGL